MDGEVLVFLRVGVVKQSGTDSPCDCRYGDRTGSKASVVVAHSIWLQMSAFVCVCSNIRVSDVDKGTLCVCVCVCVC